MESIDKVNGTFGRRPTDQKGDVPAAVIRRLPRYHRYLGDLIRSGEKRISSGKLASLMGVTASQIRQDLNCFGGFGQQGYGYNITYLYDKISELLGVKESYTAVIVGAGNLGKALASTHMFERRGVERAAMFDVSPEIVGASVYGLPVYHVSTLGEFCKNNNVDIGVLTVPKEAAGEVVGTLIDSGIKGIWNFANMELKVDVPGVVVENIHLGDSLMALCFGIKTENEKDNGND
jgi:redox-sensing transcriptional repressor